MADIGGIAGDRLKSFVERIERLEEERRSIGDDVKAVYAEAKAAGFDVKTMRKVVQRRQQDQHELFEQDELLDLYERAIGGSGMAAAAE